MAEKKFNEGVLYYSTLTVDFSGLAKEIVDFKDWEDGYLAFSNKELRLNDVNLRLDELDGRLNNKISGVEGYLMEAGLWRKKDNLVEEVFAERRETIFFVERWALLLNGAYVTGQDGWQCFWRNADVFTINKGIFGRLGAVEVIAPDLRLNVFLSLNTNEKQDGIS